MAYVWDVYNVSTTYSQTNSRTSMGGYTVGPAAMVLGGSDDTLYFSRSFTFNKNTGLYTLTGAVRYHRPGDWTASPSEHPDFNNYTPDPSGYYSPPCYVIRNSSSGTVMAYVKDGSYFEIPSFILASFSSPGTNQTIYYSIASHSRSAINSATSSDNASAYPQDAISGSYWYTYRGAPSNISYPTSIEAGQAVQITWTAGTNPLYYRVERSTDGGSSWQVLSATVTGTSFTDTTIAGDTSSPSVMYRVCTLGEMAVSDYSTGSEVNIPRCSVRIKINGAWVKGKATYRKENGAWVIIPMADEAARFGADTHRKVILLSS